MHKEVVHSPKFGKTVGPFSTAIKSNGFLFISGQVGRNDTGVLQSESIEHEARQIMTNLGTILTEAGLGYDDLVSVTIYLKDMNNFSRVNEVYKTYFAGDFPTRTCIAVADLPVGASVEITSTAALQ
jgi:2-iminobutanoate/2-iminopropanoate deaminase